MPVAPLTLLHGRCHVANRMSEHDDGEYRRLLGLAELASRVAHKLNNDLTEVTCNLGIILEDLEQGAPPEDLEELVRDALHAAEHASMMSQDALGLFRLDTSNAPLMPLLPYLQTAIPQLLAAHPTEVLWGPLDSSLNVRSTAERLDRIFAPLLANTAEASAKSLLVTLSRIEVLESDRSAHAHDDLLPGPYAQVILRDRGDGFAIDTREAFVAFVTTKGPGRGLGLATALNVARAHRGSLSCRNHDEGGAEVAVLLPAHEG